MAHKPLVLDFDGSVLPVAEDEQRLDLHNWQESVRFGTSNTGYQRLQRRLAQQMPPAYGCVFTGSGDFHHLTLFLLRHLIAAQNLGKNTLDVVVCDNHPDNMRYLFGLHCGSWVRRAAALPAVRQIHMVGLTSRDIARAWENYLRPFMRNKLTYWSIGVEARWLRSLGRGNCARSFTSAEALLAEFLPVLQTSAQVYLSIDKDVLAVDEVQTNWDQGVFSVAQLKEIIRICGGKLRGADVCGDISAYKYQSAFKNWLAGLDDQGISLTPAEISAAQKNQQRLNQELVKLLALT